jgi:hypothetical protein
METQILDAAMAALRNQGLDAELTARDVPLRTPHRRADALARIGIDGRTDEFLIEEKRRLTPAMLGATLAQLEQLKAQDNRPQVLVTDYVTPPLAERLKAENTQFADTAGNAYLRLPGMLVWVTGKKPQKATAADRTPRAFQPTGIKLLFGLICLPELAATPYREIADKTKTALGTINWVMRDLREMGYLAATKRHRRLNATKRMLDEWALAYARTLRPKLLMGRHRAPTFQDWQQWQLEKHEALWGGEPAGALLTQYLRPGVLTIYAKQVPGRMVLDYKLATVLNRQAEDGLVEFRNKFWEFDVPAETPHIVPPALVYADLLATGDARCIETARRVYDGHLARLFPKG